MGGGPHQARGTRLGGQSKGLGEKMKGGGGECRSASGWRYSSVTGD